MTVVIQDVDGREILLEGAAKAAYRASLAPAPPTAVPTLSSRQIRLWLLSQEIALSAVDAAIALLPEPQRSIARVEWEYATTFERSNPLIDQVGAALGLAPATIDQGFVDARRMWP